MSFIESGVSVPVAAQGVDQQANPELLEMAPPAAEHRPPVHEGAAIPAAENAPAAAVAEPSDVPASDPAAAGAVEAPGPAPAASAP